MVQVSKKRDSNYRRTLLRLPFVKKICTLTQIMRRFLLRLILKKDAPLVFMISLILTSLYVSYRNFLVPSDLTDRVYPIVTREDYETIPKRIWFTYKHDLLLQKKPIIYYNNIMKTIDAYRTAWGDVNAEVFVLDDSECIKILNRVNVRLTHIFNTEPIGAYKGDICRLGALYLYGGYYFDVDMEVVTPVILPSNIKFSTAWDATFGHMFNSYMAVSPKHPILETYVNVVIDYYDKKLPEDVCHTEYRLRILGPCLLHRSHKLYKITKAGKKDKDIFLLKEEHSKDQDLNNCGYEVNDPEDGTRYFFSRIEGSSSCINLPKKLWFTYEKDVLASKEPKDVYNLMMKIHDAYNEVWDIDLPMEVLTNEKCRHYLMKTDPYLFRAYAAETVVAHRNEYCKVGALHLHGGYSFDLNIDFEYPMILPHDVSFATSKTEEGFLTTTFMASTPFHPVLDNYIKSEYFKYNKPSDFCLEFEKKKFKGSCLLTEGEMKTPEKKRGVVQNILERKLKDEMGPYTFELVDPRSEKLLLRIKKSVEINEPLIHYMQ